MAGRTKSGIPAFLTGKARAHEEKGGTRRGAAAGDGETRRTVLTKNGVTLQPSETDIPGMRARTCSAWLEHGVFAASVGAGCRPVGEFGFDDVPVAGSCSAPRPRQFSPACGPMPPGPRLSGQRQGSRRGPGLRAAIPGWRADAGAPVEGRGVRAFRFPVNSRLPASGRRRCFQSSRCCRRPRRT